MSVAKSGIENKDERVVDEESEKHKHSNRHRKSREFRHHYLIAVTFTQSLSLCMHF